MSRQRITPASMLATALLIAPVAARAADDPFAAAIRPTDALTPEQERASFHLPPGFRVQLFAAEPEIQKPMNMAFDARGRLWVSGSTEYPFPAPADRPGPRLDPRSRGHRPRRPRRQGHRLRRRPEHPHRPLSVQERRRSPSASPTSSSSTTPTATARPTAARSSTGRSASDRDTHGMNNAFRRGFDGWLYANHGWANTSTVQGPRRQPRSTCQGGNTYRVRPDGVADRVLHPRPGQPVRHDVRPAGRPVQRRLPHPTDHAAAPRRVLRQLRQARTTASATSPR